MVSIGDLPVELLLAIFKAIHDEDMQMNDPADGFSVEEEYSDQSLHASTFWTEDDLHNPTLFPMTIAFVCRHWRDVLAKSPEYWNKVVFEVGRDPTPLLDAFSWSNDQLLDVLVWNRTPDLTAAGKALENERVSAITKSLTPHFHRCCRISYEVAYASSLPSIVAIFRTTPYILKQFVFEARVDDIQCDRQINSTSTVMDPMVSSSSLSVLSVLSLDARSFIDLGRAYPGWLHNLRSDSHFTLTISQFRFQRKTYSDHERSYTLPEFLSHLAAMPQPEVLRLRNLSLAYDPGIHTTDPKYYVKPLSLFLDNLGENFLAEFFERTILSCDNIFINRCTIPWINCSLNSTYLHLDNLGYIHNISNILCVWQGSHLSLDSCASFDDDLLDRLEDEGRNWCLRFLTYLTLKYCINFTSAGLRKLMTLQRVMAAAEDVGQTLDRVSVEGGRLSLWEDDISWFRQQRGSTDVSWTIIHPDGTYAYPLNHYKLGED